MNGQEQDNILRSLGFKSFGDHLSEETPPVRVDEEILYAFFRKQLSSDDRQQVIQLLSVYREWHEAGVRIATEVSKESLLHDRVKALVIARWLMRRRTVLAASGVALIIVLGVFLCWGTGRNGLRDGVNVVAFHDGTVSGLEKYGKGWSHRAWEAYEGDIGKSDVLETINDTVPRVRADRLAKAPMIIGPYGSAVTDQQPTLRWRLVEGIEEYQVEVRRVKDQHVLVSEGKVIGKNEWQVPVALEPGVVYEWRVTFSNNDQTLGAPAKREAPATLLILDETQVREVRKLERELHGSHLLLFLMYVKYGLLERADEQLGILEKANPGSKLLTRLRESWEKLY